MESTGGKYWKRVVNSGGKRIWVVLLNLAIYKRSEEIHEWNTSGEYNQAFLCAQESIRPPYSALVENILESFGVPKLVRSEKLFLISCLGWKAYR